MYEDTPQELVHDLFSEAVFGDHPLGRPVIGTARRDLVGLARRDRRVPPATPTSARTSSSRRPGTSSTSSCSRSSARAEPAALRRAPTPAARARCSSQPPPPGLRFARKDTEQYHVCVGAPGISRSDRRRFAASLLDAILGGSASSRLFQEIREKRGHGVRRLQLRLAVLGHRPRRRLRGHARGEPRGRASRSSPSSSPTSPPGNVGEASSSGRRRTSRAGSCSRWSRPRTG